MAFPESQIPEKKSKAVKPEPLGGTSTIATLFRSVTFGPLTSLRYCYCPERPLTETVEPTDAPKVPLTVIRSNEVHVVTLLVVLHAGRVCLGATPRIAANRRVAKL